VLTSALEHIDERGSFLSTQADDRVRRSRILEGSSREGAAGRNAQRNELLSRHSGRCRRYRPIPSALPGTRKEAQQVAADLKADPADIKLGLDANETAVKRAKLDQYRIVYFATHGLVSGDLEGFAKTKAEPALALTIPQRPTDFDDGLLTASEIAQLKLDAEWAVLSACNTAAEDKPGAEALSGLARAFFYAGARSLIVSHWSVSDEATARLMIGTFRASASDPRLSHAEALRQSILAMIDAAKSDAEADPRLWAPFVVVG